MNSRKYVLLSGLATVIIVAAIVVILLMNRGYGKVSPKAYQLAKALYSTCLSKNEQRLDIVEAILHETEQSSEDQVTPQERVWLDRIIRKARAGRWQSAANAARRMMEDQVEY